MTETIVTTLCYAWCNQENGREYCDIPFYLSGYGIIEEEKELNEVLTAFRRLEVLNSGQDICWHELSIHPFPDIKDLISHEISIKLPVQSQLSVVPTWIRARSGNKVWVFIINERKVVGIIK